MSAHAIASIEKVTDYTKTDVAKLVSIMTEQEAAAQFKAFSSDIAFELGSAIRQTFFEKFGTKGDMGCVVSIELFSGHTLFRIAIGNNPIVGPDNWQWVNGKLNVVRRFGISSLRVGKEWESKGLDGEKRGALFPEYAPFGGGFPIYLHNLDAPIGAILVSGLPQLDDHQVSTPERTPKAQLILFHSSSWTPSQSARICWYEKVPDMSQAQHGGESMQGKA
ncbi:hypothetical protein P7C73_g4916, partial [Tremellales sp. Uapishka_1]